MNEATTNIQDFSSASYRQVVDLALELHEKNKDSIGVLLCEGTDTSIDKAVYECVYPELIVIPVGGCTNVTRLLPKVRSTLANFKLYGFGIIDRDALSKKEIKNLHNSIGLYVTKLPFIENIICSPEVLKIVCKDRGIDFNTLIKQVQEELMKNLWQHLKETLPINLAIDEKDRLICLKISASTKKKEIEKTVTDESILYSYRDKIVASIVANHIGLKGKKAYYGYMTNLIQNKAYTNELARAFSFVVPELELYEL